MTSKTEILHVLQAMARTVTEKRHAKLMSQSALAKAAGVSPNTVFLIEAAADVRISTLAKVLAVLDEKFVVDPAAARKEVEETYVRPSREDRIIRGRGQAGEADSETP